MSDYYGVSDLSKVKPTIMETLMKKYNSSTSSSSPSAKNPPKLDRIEKDYSRRLSSQEGENSEEEEDGVKHSDLQTGDTSRNSVNDSAPQGLLQSVKTYFADAFTIAANAFYGAGESSFSEREEIRRLHAEKKTAVSYKSYVEICERLDELQKFNDWKEETESTLYDYKLIETNLRDLKAARLSGDVRKLLYLIRTTWTRNIGGIGNLNLYRHSHVGTKRLIEEYLEECQLSLDEVTKVNTNHGLDEKYIMSMLVQTRKNIGRTALVLSGGGCFGLFHIGVLAALLEENVLPRIISGSSAGAITASVLCVHTNGEIVELLQSIMERNFDIFGDPQTDGGFLKCLSRFLKYGTWYDNAGLQNTMKEFLGDLTFREAYNRSGKILNITVSPASVHEHPRLLNYLTAPSVLIWSAVCASCSLPGVFESSTIYEKNLKTGVTQEWHHASVKFVDGSVDNDMPITRLSEMFNVDHIIACQVNPHVVPFLKLSVTCVGGEIETEYSARFKAKLSQLYGMWSAEVSHYLQMSEEVGIARNICTKLRSVISQQYCGDITILPQLKEVMKFNKLLSNPTPEYLLHCQMTGARETWPKISIIRNHCGLEFALDKAIRLLRGRNFKTLNSTNIALISSPSAYNNDTSDSDTLNKNPVSLDNHANQFHDGASTSVDVNGEGNVKMHTIKRTHSSTSPNTFLTHRHHNRHRSETLSLAKLKSLRSVQSNISVSTSHDQAANKLKTQLDNGRFQRSYSTSNGEINNMFYNNDYSLPVSESSSPLKFNFNSDQGYFKLQTGSPMKKPTSNFKPKSRRNSNGYISSSTTPTNGKGTDTPIRKKSFVNVDELDGLFENGVKKKTSFEDDEAIDPIKTDEEISPSSNDL